LSESHGTNTDRAPLARMVTHLVPCLIGECSECGDVTLFYAAPSNSVEMQPKCDERATHSRGRQKRVLAAQRGHEELVSRSQHKEDTRTQDMLVTRRAQNTLVTIGTQKNTLGSCGGEIDKPCAGLSALLTSRCIICTTLWCAASHIICTTLCYCAERARSDVQLEQAHHRGRFVREMSVRPTCQPQRTHAWIPPV